MRSSISVPASQKGEVIRFAEFRFMPAEARLFKGDEIISLSPKALDVLQCLCQRAGGLVTKAELLDAVWGRRFISEGVVKNVIQELRQALGDSPKSPRFIETVHRRGYRFVGVQPDRDDPGVATGADASPSGENGSVVGRAALLAGLSGRLQESLAGQPMIVFLSGEPGIGKTTLVKHFLTSLPDEVLALEGSCLEQYGQAEPYLPVLEALDRLARHDRADLVECMRRCAPVWLAQLPWLLEEPERTHLLAQTQVVTKDRMLREFGVFLREWTSDHPLLLVLEDLHWSDKATLDLIVYLARSGPRGRWMILSSYRPVDIIVNDHPLRDALRGLKLHGLCHDLSLELLSEAAVADYLAWRFAGLPFSNQAIRAIHSRTEGLPLFLVRLADELARTQVEDGEYSLTAVEAFLKSFPDGLRMLVEMQFERLSAESRRMLDAAAVCHRNFPASALAAAMGKDILEAEAWCEGMARAGNLLCLSGTRDDADRRYDFIHAYYQELAYQGITPARRVELHRRLGEWYESNDPGRAGELAAELALHFERGRQFEKAVDYLKLAAGNADKRHAPHEVIQLLKQALALLDRELSPKRGALATRLELLSKLATAIQTTQGFASPELEPIYGQIAAYQPGHAANEWIFPLLWGAWGFYCARGRFEEAAQQAMLIERTVKQGGDPLWLIGSHVALGGVHWHRGEFDQARQHLEAALLLYGKETRPALYPVFTQDPDVLSRFFLGLVQAMQGAPDEAQETMAAALERARTLGHPFTEAFAHWGGCMLSQLRGDKARVHAQAGQMHRLADEHGFTMLLAMAEVFLGWAEVASDPNEAGLERIEAGLEWLKQTGARMWLSYFHALQADACRMAGRPEAGLQALYQAEAVIRAHGERFFAVEIRRLREALHGRAAETG